MTIYKYAGFWRRLIAYYIDNAIITIVFFILGIIAFIAYIAGGMSGESNAWIVELTDPVRMYSIVIIILVLFIVIFIAYFTYFHGATGRTPGKTLFGLQVIGEDGTPLSFDIAFLRAVGYIVSSLLFTIPLGFIWAAFDKKKQGWHDKIAGTVVIIRKQENQSAGVSISDQPTIIPEPQHNGIKSEAFKEQMN